MRFLSVQMPAFGPFTEFRLEFGSSPGLQVIYGPNESGKSSSLRAFRAFLYGVKEQTGDAFLHQYSQLRVGALLQHSDGRTLEVVRQKGRKNTLRDPNGEPVPESALAEFSGYLTQDVFERLYGLDHMSLSSGGKALLEEGGKVGESLFAANIGPAFRRVREQLRKEAEEIWKPRSRSLPLDLALSDWKKARQEAREESLQVSAFQTLMEELETEQRKAAQAQDGLSEARARLKTLQNRQTALPHWARLRELQQELEAYGDLPRLSGDFSQRREQARADYDRANHELQRLREARKRLDDQLEQLPSAWPVLEFGETIERLYQRAARVADVETELPEKTARLRLAESRVESCSRNLGDRPEGELETFPDLSSQSEARLLSRQHQALESERQSLEDALRKAEVRLARLSSELESLEDSKEFADLELLLSQGRRALGWEARIEELELELKARSVKVREGLQQLPYWSGRVEELRRLRVPPVDTVERYQHDLHQARTERASAERELSRLSGEVKRSSHRLEELDASGEIPSREKLLELRGRRQESFLKVLERWRGGDSPAQAETSLRAYSGAVKQADEHSDRMVTNADRVAARVSLQNRLKESRMQAEEAARLLERRNEELAALEAEWRELWDPSLTEIRPPAEMRRWVERRQAILHDAVGYDTLREELEELRGARDRMVDGLRVELAKLTTVEAPPLSLLTEAVGYVEQKLAAARLADSRRKTVEEQRNEVRRDLDDLQAQRSRWEEKYQAWRADWSRVAARFFPDEEATPLALDARLQGFDELRQALQERNELKEQHAKLLSEKTLFEEQTSEILKALPEWDARLEGQPPVTQAQALYAGYRRATEQARKRRDLEAQLGELQEARNKSRLELQQAQERVSALLVEASVTELDALPEVESRVRERAQLLESLREASETLRSLGGGATLEEFCQSLAAVSEEKLEHDIQELEHEVHRLEAQHAEHLRRLGELSERRKQMDGSARAAHAAEAAAQSMACGIEFARRYLRLQLADRILRDEIENYRLQNEGPILRRSSAYFSQLTCGAYTQLQSAFDDKTETPILQAVSSSGRLVTVDGLSQGTRDQLFLSLRLATIEQRTRHAEPFPLIADDVLVHFDGERALATLRVLAEFAKDHQVLLFTHLERDRVLAESLDPALAAVKTLERIKL